MVKTQKTNNNRQTEHVQEKNSILTTNYQADNVMISNNQFKVKQLIICTNEKLIQLK